MIKFDSLKHKYYDTDNTFISVTGLLKNLDDANWDEIKLAYAKKNKLTVEEVTKLWDNRKFNGTKIHAMLESEKSGESYESILNRDTVSDSVTESLDLKNTVLLGEYPELIVYSNKYKVAGKIDLPTFYEDRTFTIRDYKSDPKIEFYGTAYYNKKAGTKVVKKFTYPVAHLDNVNWNKYQLQISTYAYILEQYGYTFKGGFIDHVICQRDADKNFILDKNNKPIILEIITHEIKYLKNEARSILENNLNK